jgi:hypothetical protein
MIRCFGRRPVEREEADRIGWNQMIQFGDRVLHKIIITVFEERLFLLHQCFNTGNNILKF